MTGLLRKELYGLNSLYAKQLPLVALLYSALSLFTDQDFFIYFGVWVMMFYSLSTLSLDESSGWGRYARTLPVTTAQIVGAKFLVTLIYTGIALVYGMAMGLVRRMIGGEADLAVLAAALLAIGAVSLMMSSLMYPFAFRYGLEKARNGMLVVWMALFAGFYLFGSRLNEAAPLIELLDTIAVYPVLWLAGTLAMTATVMALCFAASCRIYGKKEF